MSAAVTALNGYSLPKVNLSFAHQKFDQLQQKQGETFLQFVLTELKKKKKGKYCNFGADFNNQIRDLVLHKCRSDYVNHELFEER